MTCNYCGFENADNAAKCIKCGAILEIQFSKTRARPSGSDSFGKTIGDKEVPPPFEKDERMFAETIRDTDTDPQEKSNIQEDILQLCQNCGFLNPGDAVVCASCKSPIIKDADGKPNQPIGKIPDIKTLDTVPVSSSGTKQGFTSTIDPYRKKHEETAPQLFSFMPVVRENEKIITGGGFWPNRKFEFEKEPTQINRESLEENNFTITSKVQAEVFFKDGKWYIIDKSELKTTFVQARNPAEIQAGDIVLMGDRKFVFSAELDDQNTSGSEHTSH